MSRRTPAERHQLQTDLELGLLRRGFSRRSFGRVLALATAGAALPFASESSLAQLSNLGRRLPPGAVKINANEFPLSLTPAATESLLQAAELGNRYQYEVTDELVGLIAAQEGVSPESVLAYPGSSIALHHAVLAFTGPQQPLITASPGYEAAAKAAEYIGAQVVKVPLRADGSHDLETMTAAAGRVGAGLIYVCSPNNPTGSITPKAEIDRLIANKPAGSVVLIDEAYIHFSEQPSSRDHVAAGRDVVVLRTFSKIYGMAGLRAGFVMARPDLLEMAKGFTAGALPATAMAAARAMLEDPDVVPQRRTLAKDIRQDLCGFFDAKGFEYAPSESFKVIVDTRLPVEKVIAGMKERQVFVGRPWPEWPTHLRVSLGSVEDMAKFKSGFLAVVGS